MNQSGLTPAHQRSNDARPPRTATIPAQPGGRPGNGEQLALWTSEPLFPGDLLQGESAAVYLGEGALDRGDFQVTAVHGHQYRVTRRSRWQIARLPNSWAASSNGGYAWLGYDSTLEEVLEWLRWDSRSRAMAVGRWKRWGHLVRDDVPFSLEVETQELEPGVLRVARFGVQGIVADYNWGWESRPDGRLPESPNRRSSAQGRLAYIVWCLTRRGFDRVPTERIRVVRSYWRQDVDCATGGPNHLGSCKRTDPQFLVEVLDQDRSMLGTVVLCAKHLGNRLGGSEGYYGPYRELTAIAQRVSGQPWLTWQDRLAELTWDLVAPAADRGQPIPDVAEILRQEALDAGERGAALTARKAARAQGLPPKAQKAAAEAARASRRALRVGLVAEAEAAEAEEWARICRETDEMTALPA